jgi:hypothetical protein
LRSITRLQDIDRAEREVIFHEARISRKRRLNVWDRDSKRTKVRDPAFKRRLVEFYDCADKKDSKKLFCQVLGRSYGSENVIGSHIWKHETKGEGLEDFGIAATEIDSARNGLIMCKGVEEAFDCLRVCFLYDFTKQALVLHVADAELKNRLVMPSQSLTFGDVDGSMLRCPTGKLPYRRLLSWHAYCVLEKFNKLDNFTPFHRLSETEKGYAFPKGDDKGIAMLAMVETGAAASDHDNDFDE